MPPSPAPAEIVILSSDVLLRHPVDYQGYLLGDAEERLTGEIKRGLRDLQVPRMATEVRGNLKKETVRNARVIILSSIVDAHADRGQMLDAAISYLRVGLNVRCHIIGLGLTELEHASEVVALRMTMTNRIATHPKCVAFLNASAEDVITAVCRALE